MTDSRDIALMSHLMRRVGFGATRQEIEVLAKQGYENTVELLLHPEDQPEIDEELLYRYHPMVETLSRDKVIGQLLWLYRMVHTRRPLQEKIALFWHHVFATGHSKIESTSEMVAQVRMFRERGLGSFRELLVEVSKNPAMIYWLDNHENHKRTPNENWGRELLELFSMGVGSYTEKDVFECARAFTGWTLSGRLYWAGPVPWRFEYHPEDHDGGVKSFLGISGRLDGEDIIDIIVEQPACARFISRHLYSFFVADEPQVPAWPHQPPQNPQAIEALSASFMESGYEIRAVLRTLLNSDFFKDSMYRRVKSPAEVVAGALRLTGDMRGPDPRWGQVPMEPGFMGQELLDPPTVEGWHMGREWITSGALMARVNFVADRVANTELPGVKAIIGQVASWGDGAQTPESIVDRCLDLMGPLEVSEPTRTELITEAKSRGPVSWDTAEAYARSSRIVADILALIAGTREYQFC